MSPCYKISRNKFFFQKRWKLNKFLFDFIPGFSSQQSACHRNMYSCGPASLCSFLLALHMVGMLIAAEEAFRKGKIKWENKTNCVHNVFNDVSIFSFFQDESTCPRQKKRKKRKEKEATMKPALKAKHDISHRASREWVKEGNSSNFHLRAAAAKTLIYCINSRLPRARVQIK